MDDGARHRLLLALAVSAALHVSLLHTLRVAPATSPPQISAVLQAQLEIGAAVPAKVHTARPAASRAAPHRPGSGGSLAPVPVPIAAISEAAAAPVQPVAFSEPANPVADPQSEVELPGVDDLTWYPARQLDVFPQPLVAYRPVYPQEAGAAGMQGEVTLLLLIDEAGAVHEASVVEAQPAGHFEQAALAAFEGARFEPARKDGRAVRSRIVVRVAFSPEPRD